MAVNFYGIKNKFIIVGVTGVGKDFILFVAFCLVFVLVHIAFVIQYSYMFLLPQLHLFLIVIDICICVAYFKEEKLIVKRYFFSDVICKME